MEEDGLQSCGQDFAGLENYVVNVALFVPTDGEGPGKFGLYCLLAQRCGVGKRGRLFLLPLVFVLYC